MKNDIKEILEIISELRQVETFAGTELATLAVQIQRNRMLDRALFEQHPNGRGSFVSLSNLQTIGEKL